MAAAITIQEDGPSNAVIIITGAAAVDTAVIDPATLGYVDLARLQRAQSLGINQVQYTVSSPNATAAQWVDIGFSNSANPAIRLFGFGTQKFEKGMGGINPVAPAVGSTVTITITPSTGFTGEYWIMLTLDKRLPNP